MIGVLWNIEYKEIKYIFFLFISIIYNLRCDVKDKYI